MLDLGTLITCQFVYRWKCVLGISGILINLYSKSEVQALFILIIVPKPKNSLEPFSDSLRLNVGYGFEEENNGCLRIVWIYLKASMFLDYGQIDPFMK
jgi:hypothetical protein